MTADFHTSKNGKVTSHDFPRLSPGFQPKFNVRWISKSQRERDGGSVSGAFGHEAPGEGHQTLDAWILSAQRPLTRCCLTPEPPRRLDYSRQSVSSCTQTLVNLIFTGLYHETPRSPCTSGVEFRMKPGESRRMLPFHFWIRGMTIMKTSTGPLQCVAVLAILFCVCVWFLRLFGFGVVGSHTINFHHILKHIIIYLAKTKV